jgi:hypothetical protein
VGIGPITLFERFADDWFHFEPCSVVEETGPKELFLLLCGGDGGMRVVFDLVGAIGIAM